MNEFSKDDASQRVAIWRQRFELSDLRRGTILAAARERPFSDAPSLTRLIGCFFKAASRNSGDTRHGLLDAAGWLLLQAWQSGSHFPAFAENYAEVLLDAVEHGRPDEYREWVASAVQSDEAGRCGLHQLVLSDSARIRESERRLHEGNFDGFLRAKSKHTEIERRVSASPELKRDWQSLRRLFPKQTRIRGILHRTLAPERNWVKGDGAAFHSVEARFQAALDLLCWKYGLWGIKGGQPLVLKPSVTVTPWGTQIFIPAWQSLDAKRDFDFAYIARLHRARGIARQGEKLSEGRLLREAQAEAAFGANGDARRSGLRGEARLGFVRQRLGIADGVDDREIRRLIALGQTRARAR